MTHRPGRGSDSSDALFGMADVLSVVGTVGWFNPLATGRLPLKGRARRERVPSGAVCT